MSLAAAQQRKGQAKDRLAQLVEKAAQINGNALSDPTVPQPSPEYQNGAQAFPKPARY